MATIIIKQDGITSEYYDISKLSISNNNNKTGVFGLILNKDTHWGDLAYIDSSQHIIIKVNKEVYTYINESNNSQTTIIGNVSYLKCLNATITGLIGGINTPKVSNIDSFIDYKKDIKDVIISNQPVEIIIKGRLEYLEVQDIPNKVYTAIKSTNTGLRVIANKSDIHIKGNVDTASIINELRLSNQKNTSKENIYT